MRGVLGKSTEPDHAHSVRRDKRRRKGTVRLGQGSTVAKATLAHEAAGAACVTSRGAAGAEGESSSAWDPCKGLNCHGIERKSVEEGAGMSGGGVAVSGEKKQGMKDEQEEGCGEGGRTWRSKIKRGAEVQVGGGGCSG